MDSVIESTVRRDREPFHSRCSVAPCQEGSNWDLYPNESSRGTAEEPGSLTS
jgi:hypothetical protein